MCASALDRAALQAAGGLLYQSVQLLDLDVAFGPAVGLHAVHSGIALTDAVLVAEEGSRSKEDDHRIAAKALEKLCVARRLDDAGVKHLRALLSNKTRYSYGDERGARRRVQVGEEEDERFPGSFYDLSTAFSGSHKADIQY